MIHAIAAVIVAQSTVPEPPGLPVQVAGEISPDSCISYVATLADFGTRHTLSETESESRGIGAARRWIKTEFERIAADSGRSGDVAITVEFDTHRIEGGRRIREPVDIVNVKMTIPGSMPEARGRLYYVIAHYDSRASGSMDAESDAPGANDDGSGTALCLEIARVLSRHTLDATVIIMPVAGEEQGLYGSRAHAKAALEAGLDVRAVLSNDIVGDPTGPGGRNARDRVRVFSEGVPPTVPSQNHWRFIRSLSAENDSNSRQLARYVAQVAELHDLPVKPMLIYRPDRFLRGGDHTGFNEVGFAAVRFTEVFENYDRQHQDVRTEGERSYGDLTEHVDGGYLADVARLNAATIVHLANAPSEPPNARIIVAGLSIDTTLRWDESPEPDVAGYEVVWRETTAPRWQHVKDVGNVTEATLPLSKDNWYFGVRAYDRDGYRSPIVFPVAAGR